jgi:acetyltransferase-like isoleucine patch superfamily enzyme
MVLKGVKIGDNAVVGAGSVVVGNVPRDAVVFGNPARVIWRFPAARPAATPGPARAPVLESSPGRAES